MNGGAPSSRLEVADDVCSLALARRLAAMLDRDPAALRTGDPLPRGWHVIMFTVPTRQCELRPDGAAGLGVTLPDLGLPRLMLGGRQARFMGDIPIGARVRRESRQGGVQLKQGRSGRFALVSVEHSIYVDGAPEPALVETNDYLLREASGTSTSERTVAPATGAKDTARQPAASRTIVPDERMLFRYSAVTDNPHRIHYDHPYAVGAEGYPALVVNGSIPAMFLLELFRSVTGREPVSFSSRNLAPMTCGQPLRLNALPDGDGWRLWSQDPRGNSTFEAMAE